MRNYGWTKAALSVVLTLSVFGAVAAAAVRWRAATADELRGVIPARAPVVKENIETEFRTASGVTDGRGRFIAGVVMITAGYSAEGRYSHFFVTQAQLRVGDFDLPPGQYVFGYERTGDETIRVRFYRASTGETVGEADAVKNRKSSAVRSLLISPPAGGRGVLQIGRFLLEYRVTGSSHGTRPAPCGITSNSPTYFSDGDIFQRRGRSRRADDSSAEPCEAFRRAGGR